MSPRCVVRSCGFFIGLCGSTWVQYRSIWVHTRYIYDFVYCFSVFKTPPCQCSVSPSHSRCFRVWKGSLVHPHHHDRGGFFRMDCPCRASLRLFWRIANRLELDRDMFEPTCNGNIMFTLGLVYFCMCRPYEHIVKTLRPMPPTPI